MAVLVNRLATLFRAPCTCECRLLLRQTASRPRQYIATTPAGVCIRIPRRMRPQHPPRHVCAETPRTPRSRRPHALPAPPLTYTTTFTPGRCPWPHGGRPPTPPTCPPRGLQTYSASRWLGGLHNSAKIQHMHCKRWANLDGRWGQQLACAGSIQQLCANFVPTVNNTHVRVCV